MNWQKIIKQPNPNIQETGDDVQDSTIAGPERQDLSRAGVRIAAGTYKDLLNEVGQLWVQAKTATVMEQKIIFGQIRKKIREKAIPEAD